MVGGKHETTYVKTREKKIMDDVKEVYKETVSSIISNQSILKRKYLIHGRTGGI